MTTDTKDILKAIGINAAGTVIGAGVFALIAFFVGKFNLVVTYWKEALPFLLIVFVVLTLVAWYRKLLKLEKELGSVKGDLISKNQSDYSRDISSIKADLAKKADRSGVPDNTAFKDLSRTVKEHKTFIHAQKGQMGELLGWIELLKEDIDDDSWRIDNTLEELEKTINGAKLSGSHITDIEEQLCRLDGKPKYNFLVSKIRKHYQE